MMVEIDIMIVQRKDDMKIQEVFASQHKFSEWWGQQKNPHDHYHVIYRSTDASVKVVKTTV